MADITTQNTKDRNPYALHDVNKKYLFGLLAFRFLCEDRRPDLNLDNDSWAIADLTYKYKSSIRVKLFKYEFFTIIRSINPPYLLQRTQVKA